MLAICTLTFTDEGFALRAASRLKSLVHNRGGRMQLDENPVTPRHHDIIIYAIAPENVPALDKLMMNHDWSDYSELRDLEPAETTL